MESTEDLKKKMLELIEEPFDGATLVCFKQSDEKTVDEKTIDVKAVFNNMNGQTMLYLMEWIAYSIFSSPIPDPYPAVIESIQRGWLKSIKELNKKQEQIEEDAKNTTPAVSQNISPIAQEVISDKIEGKPTY